MNKAELIESIAKSADVSKAAATRALDGAIKAISVALKKGDVVTLVGFGATVAVALAAADALATEGTRAEVIDLRSVAPLDEEAILASLEKTGRLVVIDESTPRCSIASDVAALCVDRGFDFLNAPVRRVTAPHTPVPFAAILEDAFRPDAARVIAAVREMG